MIGHFPMRDIPLALKVDSLCHRLLISYSSDGLSLDPIKYRLRMELWDTSKWPKKMILIKQYFRSPPSKPLIVMSTSANDSIRSK